ncbi:MAG TPA: porin family protein [Flavitalea sp.]|nr:porin family protein [Flavitalea sp.]
MKKLLIVMALPMIAFAVQAQNLSFGPTIGFGHSWTNAPLVNAERTFHPSYNIGGKMVYSFVTHWGISGDIKFSSEGQTVKIINSDAKIKARGNYIRIPLQGIYFFGKFGDMVRPKISVGPSFGFLIGGKITNTLNDTESKTTDSWNNFDFGINAAAGANIRIARATWLNLDATYYHGLTNVPKFDVKGKYRSIGINIGVTLPVATLRPK